MITIGKNYAAPTAYLFAAYVQGHIERNEAYNILVQKYRYGREGADNALDYCDEFPQRVHIPTDYRRVVG